MPTDEPRRFAILGRARGAWPSLASVLVSLFVCWIAIAITKGSLRVASDAYAQMLWGGIGDFPALADGGTFALLARPWGESATKAGILLLTGLSVSVAFVVGLFNIGAQGQMTVGALVAAVIGAQLRLPAILHVPLGLLGAALSGAAWSLIAAVLKLRRGVHEVISTIMLNWVAISLVENWLVVGPLKATASGDNSVSGTALIASTAELPRLLGGVSRLHLGFLIALAIAVALWLWLTRSTMGFESRAIGLGAEAARAAGIRVPARTYQAMAMAGALAGLAGALLVQGTEHRFPATLGAPYGFDGIAIALLGQNHPLGVAGVALFFGALRAGGTRMQLLGVHKSFPELIQGLALLFVAARLAWEKLAARLSRKTEAVEVQRA